MLARRFRSLMGRRAFAAAAPLLPCALLVPVAACGDDDGDGGDADAMAWHASTRQGQRLEVGADEGLARGPGSGPLTDLPRRTDGGQEIAVDDDGALTYTPDAAFWGADRFDYARGGARRRAHLSVLPWAAALTWENASNRAVLTGLKGGDGFGDATAVGDFDGDGDPDLAITAPGAEPGLGPDVNYGAVAFVPGRRNGTFAEGAYWAYGELEDSQLGASACALPDTDGDGRDELVVFDGRNTLYKVPGVADLAALEDGPLEAHAQLRVPALSGASEGLMCDHDVTGDGVADVVTMGWSDVFVIDGAATGEFDDLDVAVSAGAVQRWEQQQLLGPDRYLRGLTVTTDAEDAPVFVYWARTDFGAEIGRLDLTNGSIEPWLNLADGIQQVVAGDFQRDGQLDVLVHYGEHVTAYMSVLSDLPGIDLPATSPSDGSAGPLPERPDRLYVADLDDDGRDDLMMVYGFSLAFGDPATMTFGRGLKVLFGAADITTTTHEDVFAGRGGWALRGDDTQAGQGFIGTAPAVADFDGDGRTEFTLTAPEAFVPSQPAGNSGPGAVMFVRSFGE